MARLLSSEHHLTVYTHTHLFSTPTSLGGRNDYQHFTNEASWDVREHLPTRPAFPSSHAHKPFRASTLEEFMGHLEKLRPQEGSFSAISRLSGYTRAQSRAGATRSLGLAFIWHWAGRHAACPGPWFSPKLGCLVPFFMSPLVTPA